MNDEDANVYVAMDGQGRIMVFNPLAFPVVPAAWSRRRPQLRSTSMVIRPGTDELLIFSNDGDKGQGSTIFEAKAPAKSPM
jgi:lactonase